MKKLSIIFAILIPGLTCSSLKAQTGADYYLPLCTGNYVHFYTDGTPGGFGWAARNTFYSIVRSDIINGKLYYAEKGMEILDGNPTDTSVFHYFWLRKDSVGNILAGAYDPTNTGVIDSAIIINPPFLRFPNEYLTEGYSRSSILGGGIIITDSVVSVSATAGAYINCIQIRNTRKNAGNIEYIEDEYYALHLGQVKGEVLYPGTEVHVDNLVGYLAINCYVAINENVFKNKNECIIYPNPSTGKFTVTFPSTTEQIQISNSFGQALQTKYIINEKTMEFELSDNGIYIIQIRTDKQTISKELIICR